MRDEKVAQRYCDGTMNLGEDCGSSKLTECEVRMIHKERASGKAAKEIAKRYLTTTANVNRIATGSAWKHLGLEPIKLKRACGLAAKRVSVGGRVFESVKAAGAHYDLSPGTISSWVHGCKKHGKWIPPKDDCFFV